jgi:hypothetical protein
MVSGWFQFLFPYGNSRHQTPGTHSSADGLAPRMAGTEGKTIGNASAASRSPSGPPDQECPLSDGSIYKNVPEGNCAYSAALGA